MWKFPAIGTIYLLREPNSDKRRIWTIIENNSNNDTYSLFVTEICPQNGVEYIRFIKKK